MIKIIKKAAIIIVLLLVAFAGYFAYNNYLHASNDIFHAIKSDFNETVNVTGAIEVINTAQVNSKSGNTISEILVKEGDEVKAGDVLAYLNDDKVHEKDKAELNYNEALRKYRLSNSLYAAGDISKDEYLKVKNTMELAKVALDSIEIDDDLAVKSPINGVVTKIDAKIGMIAGGFMPHRLFQIDDINNIRVRVDIKEKDLYKIKIGQEAHITSDAMGDRTIFGKVSYISSVGEASVNNGTKKVVEAIIDINENEKNVKAGISAKADIIVNEYKNVLVIPIDCLVEEVDKSYVYILDGNMKKKIIVEPLVVADDEFVIRDDNTITIDNKILGVD